MSLPASPVTSAPALIPDPWLEGALREAFAEFDRELSTVLHGPQAEGVTSGNPGQDDPDAIGIPGPHPGQSPMASLPTPR